MIEKVKKWWKESNILTQQKWKLKTENKKIRELKELYTEWKRQPRPEFRR